MNLHSHIKYPAKVHKGRHFAAQQIAPGCMYEHIRVNKGIENLHKHEILKIYISKHE